MLVSNSQYEPDKGSASSYRRNVTVKGNSVSKRQLILQSHVRNEQFLRELQPILSLWLTTSLFMDYGLEDHASEGAQDPQARRGKLRVAVGLLKEMVDQLNTLLENWPNAVWLFFPDTGHGGRIRVFQEFNATIYPLYFPDAPREVPWRIRRVRGHRWCGVARRIRTESHRAFHLWDQFKAGRSPMEIARREFPSKSPRLTRKWKKELMVVHRSLERAHQLIYEQPLPNNRKLRRLCDFNLDDHVAKCSQCQNAPTVEQMCPLARDFVNQDSKS